MYNNACVCVSIEWKNLDSSISDDLSDGVW